jgi:hypothetical protein
VGNCREPAGQRHSSVLICYAPAGGQCPPHACRPPGHSSRATAHEEVSGRPQFTGCPARHPKGCRPVRHADRSTPLTGDASGRVLSVIVCGAGPATAISILVELALDRGWTIQVIATPAALEFFDQATIEQLTGSPVRSQYSKPGSPRSRIPDAIIVAPATYNTINKWAQGTSDTYALGVLAETTGMDTPIVVLPFVNAALASRVAFIRSVETLRSEGVHILLGPGGFEPHPPRTGGSRTEAFPWHLALDETDRMVDAQTRKELGAALLKGPLTWRFA